jgi:hypothetical protein
MKKIIIIGSGSNKKIIPKKTNYYICCNSSKIRISKAKVNLQCIALSESIIGNKKKIFNLKNKNFIGMSKLKSIKIRKNKINILKKAICETLLIYSNSSSKEIKKRILELKINYRLLIILSHRKVFYEIIKLLDLKKLKLILKRAGLFKILKFLITGNLPIEVKPSIGGVAVLWAKSEFKHKNIFLNGIGSSNNVYYPFGKKLKKFKFNQAHKKIDDLIISSIIKKN